MINRAFCTVTILSLLLLFSCNSDNEIKAFHTDGDNLYASHFIITKGEDGNNYLTVSDKWSSNSNKSVYLLKSSENHIDVSKEITIINVPLKRVVCMSTSHISFIDAIGEAGAISAISGGQFISNPEISEKLKNGIIKDIGFESSINFEMLLKLNPDVVFTYGISGENNLYIQKIKDLGINVIVVGDYMEEHPLGKLEYLKLFGALFGKSSVADSIFNYKKERYIEISSKVINRENRPFVLLNAPWKDVWYIPGENNYMSHLIRDAGGEVIMARTGESVSFAYSLEEVINNAYKADYWLNPNFYNSVTDLEKVNPLFSKLPVFKSGNIYNNTKKDTPGGGSDFWETGVTEPDIILEDLIKILNPEVSGNRELAYYRKLM